MEDMHTLLDEAESKWREEVKRDFPLIGNTPVVKRSTTDGRDWTFSTDLNTIFAEISESGDANLQKKFEELVSKYWEGEPEELARDTLHYLLHHEFYHPLEAPFSVEGENSDNKKIHQSIRRGVVKAEPKLAPLEQIVKVMASQNGVKDFILDNRFYIDNQEKEYVREDIIPVWDLIELQSAPSETNFYTITRLLYGLMYGPESIREYFKEKSGKDGAKIAKKALSALLKSDADVGEVEEESFFKKIKSLFRKRNPKLSAEDIQSCISSIRQVFSGEDRYQGIERFMEVLGPYVKQKMPQARPDMQDQGAGGSPQNILQDLLDDMSPEEQQGFVQGLANTSESALEEATSQLQSVQNQYGNKPKIKDETHSTIDELKNLDVLATHEYYKRNHPKVTILGGKKEGRKVCVGKQEYWKLKNSSILTQDQLSRINLQRIATFQKKSKLPWLIDLGNGTYKLDEYEIKQRDIKDIVHVDTTLDVPNCLELYIDSSGSMFGGTFGNYKVNDGSRWDMLSYVIYGLADGIVQAGRRVCKKTKMRIHNFADSQVSSSAVPVEQFWNGDINALQIMFKPNNGYDSTNLSVGNNTENKQTTYVIVTDGQLSNDVQVQAQKMRELAKNPKNQVILFEIGGTYELGRAVQGVPNITYHQVHDKNAMLQAGLEVLLAKREAGDYQ